MPSLAELLERRAYERRLIPDRALETLDEAEGFLQERGLMTRTEQSALPSLYEACHEDPYMPGSRGFGQWPETKWPWFGELADREGAYALKIHRGKHLLVTEQVAALLDPILRAELAVQLELALSQDARGRSRRRWTPVAAGAGLGQRSGNGVRLSAGSTCAVTIAGVTA